MRMKAKQRVSNVEKDMDPDTQTYRVTVVEEGETVPDDHPLVALHPYQFEPAAG